MRTILLILLACLMFGLVYAETMPEFRLQDMNGKNVALGDLLGKGPLLIDFWADYCAPCKTAMPYLHELAVKYDSLTVVMISIDAVKNQSKAKAYLKGKNFKFLALFDPEKTLAKKLNVNIPPHTFIVDKDGSIAHSHVGFEPGTEIKYEHHIRVLLGLETEPE